MFCFLGNMSSLSVGSLYLSYILPILAILMLAMKVSSGKKVSGFNLPPGSTGFPLIGETIQFVNSHPSTTLGRYIEDRSRKYGKIFRTNLMGRSTVISLDQKFNNFLLKNEGKLVEHDLPMSYQILLGTEVLDLLKNQYLRTASHEFLSIPHVRSRLLEDFEQHTLQVLGSWKEGVVFTAHEEIAKVPFYLITGSTLSIKPNDETTTNLLRLYQLMMKGAKSLPLNVPGTSFTKGLKARREVLQILQHLVEERLISTSKGNADIIHDNSDYLSKLLGAPNLTIEKIIGHIFGLILGGHETVTTAICLAIYFLSTCPKAIEQLQVEHDKIISNKRMKREYRITWEDLKQMTFTQHVVNETLRLGNVIWFLLRKTIVDVKFKDYDIPRGWNVLLLFPGMHLDVKVYKEPESFDPWRWQDMDEDEREMKESYMPFSRGFHMCAGKDLAMAEIFVFLHHLVTMYEWKLPETDLPHILYSMVGFPKGLPIKVYSRSENHY